MRVPPGQLSLDLETAVAASRPPEHQDDSGRPNPRRTRHTRAFHDDRPLGRELLSVSEVSRITGFSAHAIYRAIWSGELRASKLRGRLRIQATDVQAWVVAGRVAATRPEPVPSPRTSRPRPRSPGRGLRELLQTGTPPR
jgi:excisionase family DNA binding protein